MELVDTHCHIHFPDYELDPEEVIAAARQEGVTKLLCVGCTLTDSKLAIEFAARHDNIWASIGLHPHESTEYVRDSAALQQFRELASKPKVVAIGETGLDYYYDYSPKENQRKLFRYQLELAQEFDLPLIFHVREAPNQNLDATQSDYKLLRSGFGAGQAFDDFFDILSDFEGVRGVVHSFSTNIAILEKILSRGLYVGLNGIMTFTRDQKQLEAARAIPLGRLLLETDAPFLTPVPFRGTICQPKHVRVTAEYLSQLRGETLEELAAATSRNAKALFNLL